MAKDTTKAVAPAEETLPAEEVAVEEPKVNIQEMIDGTVRTDY